MYKRLLVMSTKQKSWQESQIGSSFYSINARHALHAATVLKPGLIYLCPTTQNGHHLACGTINGLWEVTVAVTPSSIRLYQRKPVQWMYRLTVSGKLIFLWKQAKQMCDRWSTACGEEKYLLNIYHLKGWDFKSSSRYGVQDLPSQTCKKHLSRLLIDKKSV